MFPQNDACGDDIDTIEPIDPQQVTRREFRSLVFHLLYAVDATDYQDSLSAIVDTFNRGFDLTIAPDGEVARVAQAIIDQREQLDESFKPFLLNWRFERLGLCTKLILRLAFWEIEQQETPVTIVINEAIELAKCFAEKDAYKFINGILDEAAKARAEKA
ncbi:MAG TPA: transcription antitermination factor NusB [Candidatus Limnocylindria bacterium]|nr:transcription antitermination factor NusB [Candidatus Limnocylindria bacterium]